MADRTDSHLTPAVFLDKDGTLLENVPFNVDPLQMRWTAGAQSALRRLSQTGMPLIVVSNQPGVALGYFIQSELRLVEARLQRMFASCGASLTGFYYCPHAPHRAAGFSCTCRKPQPGMLRRAARNHGVDLSRSWMVGDILDDVEAGRAAGCTTVLIDNGNENDNGHGQKCERVPECAQYARQRATFSCRGNHRELRRLSPRSVRA